MDSFDLDNALWQYAVQLYGQSGVSDACMRLQDEGGVDVVLMLSAFHAHACLAQPLSRAELSRLAADIHDWRSAVIEPLRGVRRWLKSTDPAMPGKVGENLRNAVKAMELDAERIQIAVIFQWLRRREPAPEGLGTPELGWFLTDPAKAVSLAAPFDLVAAAAARPRRHGT